jgi:hypothetical protein
LALAALIIAPYGQASNIDTYMFLTVGRGMLHGVAPYAGTWEDKPPAIYLLSALAEAIRPSDAVALLQAVSVGAIAATALLLARIIDWYSGRRWIAGVGALLASAWLATPKLSVGGGLTELLLCLAWLYQSPCSFDINALRVDKPWS